MNVTPIGFGAFKIGRNQKIKYPSEYELPVIEEVRLLLNGILDLGINYIDTAPAYGLSEERIGECVSHRRSEFVLSTKVGENFEDGESVIDFSEDAVRSSIHRSFERLRTDVLDMVFIHSDGSDLTILNDTPTVSILQGFKDAGTAKGIGLSAKTVEGARQSLDWADAIMVEYHLNDRSFEPVMQEASDAGKSVMVKKGLSSGWLDPAEAIRFVVSNPCVTSLVIGGLNLDHMQENLIAVQSARDS